MDKTVFPIPPNSILSNKTTTNGFPHLLRENELLKKKLIGAKYLRRAHMLIDITQNISFVKKMEMHLFGAETFHETMMTMMSNIHLRTDPRYKQYVYGITCISRFHYNIRHKHAGMCQYGDCTGPMLPASDQYRPSTGNYRHVYRVPEDGLQQ